MAVVVPTSDDPPTKAVLDDAFVTICGYIDADRVSLASGTTATTAAQTEVDTHKTKFKNLVSALMRDENFRIIDTTIRSRGGSSLLTAWSEFIAEIYS